MERVVLSTDGLLAYCRPGFEPELAAELSERAALAGFPGYARTERNAGFVEQPLAEVERVVGERRDVGIGIEGPVGRRAHAKAQPCQPGIEHLPILGVMRLLHLGIVPLAERCSRRHLTQRRGGDEQVLLQHLGAPHQVLGQHHPADAPAGHAVVFGERVDDDGIVADLQRRRLFRAIGQAVIDLVGDQRDALPLAIVIDRLQLLA